MDQIIRNKDLSGDQVRSFISIDLEDRQVLSRIASILSSLQALGGDLKPVEGENVHLTLKFLGNVSTSRLAEVKSSLQQLTFPSFTAEIKGAGAFPNVKHMNVIWVGVDEGWTQVEQIFQEGKPSLQSSHHDSPGPVRPKEGRDRQFPSTPNRREFWHTHRGKGPPQTEHSLEFRAEILDLARNSLAKTIGRHRSTFKY